MHPNSITMSSKKTKCNIVVIALFLVLASCGSPDSITLDRPLNSVVVQLVAEPDQLNPPFAGNQYAAEVIQEIFSYLLAYDPESGTYMPHLAESRPEETAITEGPWKGGKAYSFRIHDAAVWEDGSPVTGHDFAFTLKAVFNPYVEVPAYRAYLSFIRDVEVSEEDPKSFVVLTDEPFIQAVEYIANALPVLPAYHFDPDGILDNYPLSELTRPQAKEMKGTHPDLEAFARSFSDPDFSHRPEKITGSGPYRLTSWEAGSALRLEKKADWWGDGLSESHPTLTANPDEIIYRIIPDAGTSAAALRAGELDVALAVDPSTFVQLRDQPWMQDNYQFFHPPQNAYYFIYLNLRKPILSDHAVRQALAQAIDVDAIINGVYQGFGERTSGPVHPLANYKASDSKPYAFDPAKARKLLADSGWEDSDQDGTLDKVIGGNRTDLELDYLFSANRETSRDAALLIQDDLRDIGVKLDLVPLESREILGRLDRADFDLVSWGKTIPLTLWNPKQEYHTTGQNRPGFGNAESDRLIDQILVSPDSEKRQELYMRLQDILYESIPEIPLFIPEGRLVVHQRFEPTFTPLYPNLIVPRLKLKSEFGNEGG